MTTARYLRADGKPIHVARTAADCGRTCPSSPAVAFDQPAPATDVLLERAVAELRSPRRPHSHAARRHRRRRGATPPPATLPAQR